MIDREGNGLVFVLSTPRAGSTLVAAILGSHSAVCSPPEPWVLLPIIALHSDRLLVTAPYDHSAAGRALDDFMDDEMRDEAVRAYALAAYNHRLARDSKRILVDKTPRYYQFLGEISRLFPAARQIWVQRNPLDAVASAREVWGLGLDEILGKSISPASFDMTVAFRLLGTHFRGENANRLVLKYERLTEDVQNVVESLCSFLGISFEERMLTYGRADGLVARYRAATMGDRKVLEHERVHQASVGRWRTLLAPGEVRDILMTLGTAVFTELGYGAELDEALSFAGLPYDAVPADGRLDELLLVFDAYANAAADSEARRLVGESDLHDTLVRRRYEQLHDELATLQSELEAKESVIRELRAASEERLEVIKQLHEQLSA